MRISIINGPNLNLLGRREPEIYGTRTFEEFFQDLQTAFPEIQLIYYQSNHEGDLIDRIHTDGFELDGIILNAGGYTHSSVSLRDAISSVPAPVVEVHISDIYSREDFRKRNMLADVCVHSIVGHGLQGYHEAITFLRAKDR